MPSQWIRFESKLALEQAFFPESKDAMGSRDAIGIKRCHWDQEMPLGLACAFETGTDGEGVMISTAF